MLRQRLTYIAMSLFVSWQTLAMIVAPAPDSYLAQSLRRVMHPYLTLLRMDNTWDFFAPNVGEGSRLRYVVEGKDGKRHTFNPADGLSWLHPNFFWRRFWYDAIMEDPDQYADAAGLRFCEQHAALDPVTVTLLEREERRFTRNDYLRGKRRNAPEFFTVRTITRVKCQE